MKTISVEYTVTSNRLVTVSVPNSFSMDSDEETILDLIHQAEENDESVALDTDRREIVQVYEEEPDWEIMNRERYEEVFKMSEAELFDELYSDYADELDEVDE